MWVGVGVAVTRTAVFSIAMIALSYVTTVTRVSWNRPGKSRDFVTAGERFEQG